MFASLVSFSSWWCVPFIRHSLFLCFVIPNTFSDLQHFNGFMFGCDLVFLLVRFFNTVLLSHWIDEPATIFVFASLLHFITHWNSTLNKWKQTHTHTHTARGKLPECFCLLCTLIFCSLSFHDHLECQLLLTEQGCLCLCQFAASLSTFISRLMLSNFKTVCVISKKTFSSVDCSVSYFFCGCCVFFLICLWLFFIFSLY